MSDTLSRRLSTKGLPMLTTQRVKDLGFQFSRSFNLHKKTVFQIADANRTNDLIVKPFRTQRCRLILYKSHCRSQLEYCLIIFSNVHRVDRVEVELIQRSFTNYSWSNIQPTLRRAMGAATPRPPLVTSCRAKPHTLSQAPRVAITRDLEPQPIRKGALSSTMKSTAISNSFRSKFFAGVYSTLWNGLPSHVRSCWNRT